ncbi:hypothetical protein [Micromonospora sp.]|uniref:hypothetical protein n=1 Tax=unclassified Micromonospora TaxID=2617518 RepID=UPI003B3B002A
MIRRLAPKRTTPSPDVTTRARRRLPRRSLLGLFLALAVLGGAAVAPSAAMANVDVTIGSSDVNVRDCYHPAPKKAWPGSWCTLQATLEAHLPVRMVCQYPGDGVGPQGDYYWDYVLYPATSRHGSGEGYVSDWYVNTGVSSYPYRDYRVPLCNY